MPSVLVIDDDRAILHFFRESFKGTDIEVITAGQATQGLELAAAHTPDAVLLDIMLPGISGLELYAKLRNLDARLPVIFITAGGSSDTAIEAMKLGAYDYLLKPLDIGNVRTVLQAALEMRRMMHVPVKVDPSDDEKGSDPLLGRSPQMLEVYKAIGRAAPQDVTVLIRGESGTGKELIARAIYQHSLRATGPFLAVNCAAIPDTLLESELFGHEKGSFTGADRRRIGKFEQCTGGTIFLDEVGDMSPLVQGKLLRLLQEQRFERVGGNEEIQTNVRIVTATNRPLEAMVADETFRADLYYRLNGFTIDLPPLRERGTDLRLLIDRFLVRFSRELGKSVEGLSPEALQVLLDYRWPGNVRELQSVLRQALLHATGPVIMPDFLPAVVRTGVAQGAAQPVEEGESCDLRQFVDQRLQEGSTSLHADAVAMMEKYVLSRVLALTSGNQSKAAQVLGITRGSLRNKIHSLGIHIGHVIQVEDESEDESRAATS